jgi:hypothetical protein
MRLSFARQLKRVTLLSSVSALAVVASIAVTATPASADPSCNTFTSGGVTFSVCVNKVNSTTAEAQIKDISGTYVSGALGLYKDNREVEVSCSGRYRPGNDCKFSYSGGSGKYQSIWHSKGSGDFSSPTIPV